MFVNFAQLLRAYSAFNNEGIMSTPQIVDYVKDSDGKVYDTSTIPPSEACSIQTANEVKNMLISVVQNGTGKGAIYEGLEVGGKTGTAHVAKNGVYIASYHSSFYGFVNDERGAKYTIGVFVIKPRNLYFASEVAVPVFHKVVEGMVKFGYLKPTMPR
jgi:cell division protein FtsI (penicillin-binding protein 3)